MSEFFKNFFSSQAFFSRVVRGVVLAGAAATATGNVPINPKYAWIPALLAGLVAVGEKNPTPPAP